MTNEKQNEIKDQVNYFVGQFGAEWIEGQKEILADQIERRFKVNNASTIEALQFKIAYATQLLSGK